MQKRFARPQHYTIVQEILDSKIYQNYKKYKGPEFNHSRKMKANTRASKYPFDATPYQTASKFSFGLWDWLSLSLLLLLKYCVLVLKCEWAFFPRQGITASTARSLCLLDALDTQHPITTWAGMSAASLSQGNGSHLLSCLRQTMLFKWFLREDCERLIWKRENKKRNAANQWRPATQETPVKPSTVPTLPA